MNAYSALPEIRWGIIGSGDVAEHKSGPALYRIPGSRLVAVMSRREDRAADFARRHGAERYYTTAEALIDDPEVNAVYIGTPPHMHPELTAMAARAGKHVLCEKPMANTVVECRQMVRSCADHGVQLMIAYYRRFFPVVRKMKDLLQRGAIGDAIRVTASVAAPYTLRPGGERSWLVDPSVAGGGFLTDVATHRIDLMVHFMGEPVQVVAFTDTQHLDIAVDDASSVLIRFANGVHGVVMANWNANSGIDDFEILGTKGRLVTRSLSGAGELEVVTSSGAESFRLPAPAITHLHLVEHFVECLKEGHPNALSGEEGLQATRVTEAAYRSSRENRFVEA